MRTFTIADNDGIVILEDGNQILDDDGTPRTWGAEKTAIQWLRRIAQREGERYEIIKLDGSPVYLEYRPSPMYRLGEHDWRKANVMALADRIGPYDKLVCRICGKMVRRYRSRRHFREEHEPCDKNFVLVETE